MLQAFTDIVQNGKSAQLKITTLSTIGLLLRRRKEVEEEEDALLAEDHVNKEKDKLKERLSIELSLKVLERLSFTWLLTNLDDISNTLTISTSSMNQNYSAANVLTSLRYIQYYINLINILVWNLYHKGIKEKLILKEKKLQSWSVAFSPTNTTLNPAAPLSYRDNINTLIPAHPFLSFFVYCLMILVCCSFLLLFVKSIFHAFLIVSFA